MDTQLTQAALDCARTAFGGASIVATTTLRDRPGWSVERLALVPGTGTRSVLAKTARARERAALEVLTGGSLAPRTGTSRWDPAGRCGPDRACSCSTGSESLPRPTRMASSADSRPVR